jgi:hypothetical protein
MLKNSRSYDHWAVFEKPNILLRQGPIKATKALRTDQTGCTDMAQLMEKRVKYCGG